MTHLNVSYLSQNLGEWLLALNCVATLIFAFSRAPIITVL